MKKLLAVLLSLVMVFSLTAVPVLAVEDTDVTDVVVEENESIADSFGSVIDSAEDICDSFKNEDYKGVATGVFAFAEDLFVAIHNLVHSLSEMFDFDCPFCDEDKDAGCDEDAGEDEDADKEDEKLYETAGVIIGAEFADKALKFDQPYPISVDAAYVFTVPTKSIEIDGIATAYVKSVIILEEGATTGKIVFTSEAVENYFHNVEGFKLIINNSGAPVPVVLKGDLAFTNGTVINAANIGDYIDGPYTLTVY